KKLQNRNAAVTRTSRSDSISGYDALSFRRIYLPSSRLENHVRGRRDVDPGSDHTGPNYFATAARRSRIRTRRGRDDGEPVVRSLFRVAAGRERSTGGIELQR